MSSNNDASLSIFSVHVLLTTRDDHDCRLLACLLACLLCDCLLVLAEKMDVVPMLLVVLDRVIDE